MRERGLDLLVRLGQRGPELQPVAGARDIAQILPALLPVVGDIRRVPAALSLVYLAAGRFDAGLLLHTKLWDIAAGLLVAAEAGVVLSGPDGTPTPELTLAAAPGLWHEFSEAAALAVPRPV